MTEKAMPVNLNKPERWKDDIAQSVDFYNHWFMSFAPVTYREARVDVTRRVIRAIQHTDNLRQISPAMLLNEPTALLMLRSATAPPLARDRLSGLANVSRSFIKRMEVQGKLPIGQSQGQLERALSRICEIILRLLDHDVFPWLKSETQPTDAEVQRAATIVADRLTGATADPIIRNAQEQRQLATIGAFLQARGYVEERPPSSAGLDQMQPGTYTFRYGVLAGGEHKVNIPIDAVVQPYQLRPDRIPLLIEAKSAGDFTNVNKRRKEEATKMRQLKDTYGDNVPFILFLNGYFDAAYLGYEAAEGIDWVWEHRISDLEHFGV